MAALWAAGPEPIMRRRVWVGIAGEGVVVWGRGWVRDGKGLVKERVVAKRVRGRVERRGEGRWRKEENRVLVGGGMVRDLGEVVEMLRWDGAG